MTGVKVSLDSPPRSLGDIGRFHSASVYCGLKSADPGRGQGDLTLVWNEGPCQAAGVFTRNKVAAAPVIISKDRLESGTARAIVVNAGNANCCTGKQGNTDALETARLAAALVGAGEEEVLIASTGVIGRPMPMEKIRSGLDAIAPLVGPGGGGDPATAIMTTDTVPKPASVRASVGSLEFSIAGIAKGAGMIAPDMATMLSFLVTDIAVEPGLLRRALTTAADQSLNRVTIDGDTSTNDTLIILADGSAGGEELADESSDLYDAFTSALTAVCIELSKAIARDGEGAEHFVEVNVSGAADDNQATRAARTVADSPLVKTAIAGADPNWGRILAAVGRAGVDFEPAKATVSVCDVEVYSKGEPRPENEELAGAELKKPDVIISIKLDLGSGSSRIWTCDLTHGYIEINADYHT